MTKVSEKVAKRYAKALFELCDHSELDAILSQLKSVVSEWETSKELQASVANPSFPIRERGNVLIAVAEKVGANDAKVKNLLLTMLEQGRVSGLSLIANNFSLMIQSLRNALAFEITSAFDVPDTEKNSFAERFKKDFGPLSTLKWSKDSKILGGLVIRAGDRVLDKSIKGAMSKIQEELTAR